VGYYDIYYRAEVRSVHRLSPNMIRVCFGSGDLAGWVSTGRGDERLVIVFPHAGDTEPPAPQRNADGTYDYLDEASRPEMRSYTVRAWDERTQEMLIDFVTHDGGVATPWVLAAQPGHTVFVTEAVGWYDPPADTAWELLVADMTALPALGRIVEQLPAGRRAYVIAEVIEPADEQLLGSGTRVETRWLHGSGHGRTPSGLLAALQGFCWPDGPGYLWFAGEAAESRAVRRYLRRERGWSADRYAILGYWRVHKQEWTRRYEELAPRLEHVYTEAVAGGLSSTDALELYDDALAEAGL